MSTTPKIAEEIAFLMPAIARRMLMGFFQSIDITQTQVFTIMTLSEKAPCRLCELSDKLHISAPSVTGIVDRLEKMDYVKRVPDKEDRRVINVDLTPKGQKIAKKLKTTIKKKWEEILVGLPKSDQENYLRILRKIQGNMQ